MKKNFLAVATAIALATVLSGCANISYIVDNYSGVPVQEISTRYDTFRVFDKPGENRMMVTASLASAAGQGLVGGLMMNPTLGATPKPVYQEAVEAFLARSGRQCLVTDGHLLAEPQWEFRYRCEGQKLASN
jgi:hypothetical protein